MTQPIDLRPAAVTGKVISNSRTEGAASRAATSGQGAVAAVTRLDTLKLTDGALILQQTASADSSSTTQRARVEQIRLAVADGRYPIDSRSVAGKLTRLEYELGLR